jgi:hypothetical protein
MFSKLAAGCYSLLALTPNAFDDLNLIERFLAFLIDDHRRSP